MEVRQVGSWKKDAFASQISSERYKQVGDKEINMVPGPGRTLNVSLGRMEKKEPS